MTTVTAMSRAVSMQRRLVASVAWQRHRYFSSCVSSMAAAASTTTTTITTVPAYQVAFQNINSCVNGSSIRFHSSRGRRMSSAGQVALMSTTATDTNTNSGTTKMEFQAETKQLLDIVTHSLYTDKEVFLRELVSNASDALEKLRHLRAVSSQQSNVDPDVPMEIRISTDDENNTITITDTGVGLTRKEMMDNLGTIARSGSKNFLKEQELAQEGIGDGLTSIIGKFGVGFYSAFMVGSKVEVRSKSAYEEAEGEKPTPLLWCSEGIGSYEISELSPEVNQVRGASIVIHLKEDMAEYADASRVESILKKYSNFVTFPIFLNGKRVNTMDAVWSIEPNKVTDEMHSEFYKYVANAFDEPLYNLHFRVDAPLEMKALLYVPSFHTEKYGMERMEPGVSLYSRKVLVLSKSTDIVPDWMRFVKGVVDSEDLPLSISREKPQDTALIKKLRGALTRKFISHLTSMVKKSPDQYKNEFFPEFGHFLKEGIAQDYEFQDKLAKLLYFESSKTVAGEMTNLNEYISRCPAEQKDIYYLCSPNRELAMESPYLEAFDKSDREVIFVYSAIDDFVMTNLSKFEGRNLISAEKSNIDLGKDKGGDEEEDNGSGLSRVEAQELCEWLQTTLKDKVAKTRVTTRLSGSPAVITDHESGALRRMMRLVDTKAGPGLSQKLPLQTLEVNPKHPIIVGLNTVKTSQPELAVILADQILDNCFVAAGIMDDSRSMLPRLNDILLCLVNDAKSKASSNTVVEDNDDASKKQDQVEIEK